MKQYQLWAWVDYYPSHGTGNFYGSYDTVEDAIAAREALRSKRKSGWMDGTLPHDNYEVTTFDAASDSFITVREFRST